MLCLHRHLQDDDEEEVVFSLQRRGDLEEEEGEVWPNGNLVEVGFLYLVEVRFQRFSLVDVPFQSFYFAEFSL